MRKEGHFRCPGVESFICSADMTETEKLRKRNGILSRDRVGRGIV